MKTGFARIVEHERLYGDTHIMWFAAPEILRGGTPGQFVMLRCVEPTVPGESPPMSATLPADPLLPRAMSIHRVREGSSSQEWSILYDVVGAGTRWLATQEQGDDLFCWGPLGHGYDVKNGSKHLLLIGGGIGVAPLIWLADEAVGTGRSVTMVLGGRTSEQIFPAHLLPREVELIVYTEDGSSGRKGLATDGFTEYLAWCDQAFACGPNAMFAAMADVMRQQQLRRSAQVLLEERMGCGTGICYGCAVETRKGMRLVCKDGPRFELNEIY
jgi:dihydroorotate dehydrogenase electron transfer subunit